MITKERIVERIVDFVHKNPRIVAKLPAAVILAVAVGLFASRGDNEADQTKASGQIDSNKAVFEIYLPEGMPSEQAITEQLVGEPPIFLPDVLALMKNTGDPRLVAAAEKLGNLYAYWSVEVVDKLLPEETNLAAQRGLFPGSLLEWDWTRQKTLRITIPAAWLSDPAIGEADLAYHLLANLNFARRLEGTANLTIEKMQAALVEADKEALGAMGPMAARVKNPLLRHNIAQHRAATQYPPEVTK